MRTPFVAKVDEASRAAWPPVQQAIGVTMRSLAELASIAEDVVPKVDDYVNRGAAGSVRRRKICEETVWALANLGWLRTGTERDVILAAKNWIDADPQTASHQELDEADEKLTEAVLALPEYMTVPPKEASA